MTARNRLLFVAYYFPPAPGIASVRTWNIARQLSRRGWAVTVLTPDASLWRAAADPLHVDRDCEKEGIQRVFTAQRFRGPVAAYVKCWNTGIAYWVNGAIRKVLLRLGREREIGWLAPAEGICRHFRDRAFDVIVATGGPFISFTLARAAATRVRCPYVLDYRDLWTLNPHCPGFNNGRVRRLERSAIEGASAISTISECYAELLDQEFHCGPKVHAIRNGIDTEALSTVEPRAFDELAVVYAGTLLPPLRTAKPLLDALAFIKRDSPAFYQRMRFHYYGPNAAHALKTAGECGVLDRVVCHGVVSKAEALAAMKGASVTCVVTSVKPEGSLAENGIMTGKLYEAIGLGCNVLLIAPRGGEAVRVLEDTRSGESFRGGQVREIASFICNCTATNRPEQRNLEAYEWDALGGKYAAMIESCVLAGARA